jgi:murein DD-endopeptidase MepM/ murein hydrolase activator NlpD
MNILKLTKTVSKVKNNSLIFFLILSNILLTFLYFNKIFQYNEEIIKNEHQRNEYFLAIQERDSIINDIIIYIDLYDEINGYFDKYKKTNIKNYIQINYAKKSKQNENNNNNNYIPSVFPVKPYDLRNKKIGKFGMRLHPILHVLRMHDGIDISGIVNSGVIATANGIVKCVKKDTYGYGNYIIIDHGNGYETRYAHLNKINVIKNQYVSKGELIGLVGNTGLSTAPHLHYEVRYNGKPLNPIKFFKKN